MAASIPNEQVLKAIVALHHYEQKRPPAKKTALVPENGLFWLIISLKKIPQAPKRPIRVPLQHSLNPLQETDVCLITKDNKKSVKDLLSCHDVTFITKVIPVDKLKTDFKTFERKRSLCSSFNVFLSDGRIYHRLPKLLGKTFYSRKR
jgi:ribosome biogenesis protein UTP30